MKILEEIKAKALEHQKNKMQVMVKADDLLAMVRVIEDLNAYVGRGNNFEAILSQSGLKSVIDSLNSLELIDRDKDE